jgi:predicted RNase H-like HicB family nuclease
VLSGASDADRLGFKKRVRGSHHLFRREGVEEMINLQRDGANAKPYQVRQVRWVITKYRLGNVEMKYEVIIYWSNDDEAFVAEVPELPGCIAHGSTQQAALRSAQNAADLWLETAKEMGDRIPEPRGRRLIFA